MARQPRRVRTEPQPGVDPTPQKFPATAGRPETIRAVAAAEDRLDAWGERVIQDDEGLNVRDDTADSNDDRLRENIPPHNV